VLKGWLSAAFVIFVWGVTFANTRALLFDFSALEIQVSRFVLAWAALWGMEIVWRPLNGANEVACNCSP